ncbi:hypothetical protein [Labilibaculum antarcticum]|uniref:Uncharacterized protein n=1 Tax=Labilibaculum antarcticum TaxID=1717717 RepID=A0A1Y1CI88_9BACT|nr:hypothetical protein [Labilibaculum antarcticum]BAX80086.1 hypothetical protein ALGA_1712 [Labilibaculum antarcticum]
MNFTIRLEKIKSVEKIEGYWTKVDYINLLELFDYADAESLPEADLLEMLTMAISDFEPNEAAEILLRYKLSDFLKEGQIQNLSHEMLEDKVSEEYSDISLHYPLFSINQFLYETYNGKFPKILASVIDIELIFKSKIDITKEIVLRTISDLLSERSLLKRLFDEQLDSENELKDANSIIWELKPMGENRYQLITSDYWLNKEDFENDEFSGVLSDEEITH